MKIRSVTFNNRRKSFEVTTSRGSLSFPYAKADPSPSAEDPLVEVFVDKELGREGFTYVLRSGTEGTVHIEQVLDYNQDFHFGPGTVTGYTPAAPNTTSFRAEPCTSPPPVGARARPSAHRR